MSQMNYEKQWANVIVICQLNKFRDEMTIMIIHNHQLSFAVRFCIEMINEMSQKYHRYFMRCEVIRRWNNSSFFEQFITESIVHYILFLNDDNRRWWRLVSSINHFKDNDESAIFKTDDIEFFHVIKHYNLFFLHTFYSKFDFIKVENISFFLMFNSLKFLRYFWNQCRTFFVCSIDDRANVKSLMRIICNLIFFHQLLNQREIESLKSKFWLRFKCLIALKITNFVDWMLYVSKKRMNSCRVSIWCVFNILFWLSCFFTVVSLSTAIELIRAI